VRATFESEQVAAAEDALRRAVDTTPAFIHTARPDGYLDYFNRGWLDLFGKSLEEVCGWRWTEVVHPDDVAGIVQKWHSALASGEPFEAEARVRCADGTYRAFLHRKVPLHDENGKIAKWFGSSIDIEDRKRAEENIAQKTRELQGSEFYLREGERLAHMGSWSLKSDGTFDYWSPETFVIFDFDPSGGIPTLEQWLALLEPNDRELLQRTIDKMFCEGIRGDVTYRIDHPKQGRRIMHSTGEPMIENGKVVRLIGNTLDITERKRAETLLAGEKRVLEMIATGVPLKEILNVLCLIIEEQRKNTLASILLLNPDGVHLDVIAGPSLPKEWTCQMEKLPIGPCAASCGTAAYRGSPVMVSDIASDPLWDVPEHRAAALSHGLRASWSIPVLSSQGNVLADFCMYCREVRTPTPQDLELIEFATHQARVAIERDKAIEEIKALKDQLQRENIVLRAEIGSTSMFEEVLGTSTALRNVLALAAKVAPTDSTVLIAGETGTGKELIARAIHKRSKRGEHSFVGVNCAAIPSSLIMSELFGHEKGAFTGAVQRRLGRFELAEGGTLFLDEVGDLPLETQISLLRVLQEREFERVGSTEAIRCDVRVIAATNRDLHVAIAAGFFRSDLFYRLNVFPIELPPLRERKEDIPILVNYFVKRYAERVGRKIESIQKKSLEALQEYSWPGNVRELQNVIERSLIVADTNEFSVDKNWFSHEFQSCSPAQPSVKTSTERDQIEAVLAQSHGRISGKNGAAVKLGMPASTLESKIRALRINKHAYKGS
jgi:formate hydrogenlyase transcriptional activator